MPHTRKTQAHWFIDGRFARISHKTHPGSARWYARVISEGIVRPETPSTSGSESSATDLQMCSIGHFRAHSRSSAVR